MPAEWDSSELLDHLEESRRKLREAKNEAIDVVAQELLKFVRSEFERLSAGRASLTGVKWSPRKRPLPTPLGVVTGNLRRSIRLKVRRGSRQSATVVFAAPHAHLFERYRELLPKHIPRSIELRLESLLARKVAALRLAA